MSARLRPRLALALATALAPSAAPLWAAASIAGATLFAACSSDDNEAPSGPSTFDPPGAGSGGAGGASGSAGTGGQAGAGGNGGTGGVAPNCVGTDGCFSASCTPQTTADFLNRCTDASCAPFDNVARLPLFNGGSLPPLP